MHTPSTQSEARRADTSNSRNRVSRRTRRGVFATCAMTSLALVLSGCNTMPTSNDGSSTGASSYVASCLVGAAGGAALSAIYEKMTGKKSNPADVRKDLAKAAVAGCAIGLAATAIGKLMDQRQQAKHEEEMQKEARRRALEQQQYAAATQKAQALPAATAQQRAARDAELEKARAAYQTSINQPVKVDLGGGGTSTIQVQPQLPAAGGATPLPAGQASCTDFSVLVNTASGQARQYETWCPNSAGQMVRTDVRATPT